MKRYDIENIEPKQVLYWFKKISEIPHGSYHEEAISKYVADVCKKFCDDVIVYRSGMILAKQKGTKGYEDRTPILLQSHLDMVLAKTTDCPKDLTKEHIDVYYDPELDVITAQNTTLGGDNGLGVAAMLAIMENRNNDIEHGPLEYCFTVNEEDKPGECITIDFKPEDSKARYYVNVDGAGVHELIYGSAGTITAKYDNKVNFIEKDMSFPTFRINLTGFKGGHSGVEIHKPHMNAIVFLAETLLSFVKTYNTTVCLSHFHGGPINNAIPVFAHADVNIDPKHASDLQAWFQRALTVAKKVCQGHENNVQVEITRLEKQATTCLNVHDTLRMLVAIACCPNKVFIPKDDYKVMFSSSNLGLVNLDAESKSFKADFKIRGFIDEDVTRNVLKISYYMSNFGWPNFTVQGLCKSFINDVKTNAAARSWMNSYKKITGRDLKAEIIGGGLELTEFCAKRPSITPNTICVGPTIYKEHSPDEAAPIEDLKLFWKTMKDFLKNIL